MSTVGMTGLQPAVGAALDDVTDADRAWFEAHLHRAYRLRRMALGEVLPGQPVTPGSYVVVATLGSPLVRFRVPVGRPPAYLRQDTDRACIEIIRLMTGAGYAVNGRPLGVALTRLRAGVVEVLKQHGTNEVQP